MHLLTATQSSTIELCSLLFSSSDKSYCQFSGGRSNFMVNDWFGQNTFIVGHLIWQKFLSLHCLKYLPTMQYLNVMEWVKCAVKSNKESTNYSYKGWLEVAGPCSCTGLLLWAGNLCHASRPIRNEYSGLSTNQRPAFGQVEEQTEDRQREVYAAEACSELRSEDSLAQR